jgi:phenylalanyl-tRNA synthetase beta chain
MLRARRLAQVLGSEIPIPDAVRLLEPLGFRALDVTSQSVTVAVPGHRWQDVRGEIDLVEEVARRYGYDNFPAGLGAFHPGAVPDDVLLRLEDRIREVLVGLGLLEARTAAFAPQAEGDVALLHPLSAAESRLRRALAPGLLHRVEFNFTRGNRDVRLFGSAAFAAAVTWRNPATGAGARRRRLLERAAGTFDIWDLKGRVRRSLRLALGWAGTASARGWTPLPVSACRRAGQLAG